MLLYIEGAENRPQKYGAPNSSLDHLVLVSSERDRSIIN